jgi:hypothetical protein
MNSTEVSTQKYFERSGYLINKVPETDSKTPDFEGIGILVEVKQVTPEEVEGLSNDSTYNAVKNNLRDAARKFRAYDADHGKKHIVVIYSNEIVRDDIYSVWTGEWSPEHKDRVFKGGMLLSGKHKQHIDAIAWFRKEVDKAPQYVWAVSDDLKQYFPDTKP